MKDKLIAVEIKGILFFLTRKQAEDLVKTIKDKLKGGKREP